MEKACDYSKQTCRQAKQKSELVQKKFLIITNDCLEKGI